MLDHILDSLGRVICLIIFFSFLTWIDYGASGGGISLVGVAVLVILLLRLIQLLMRRRVQNAELSQKLERSIESAQFRKKSG